MCEYSKWTKKRYKQVIQRNEQKRANPYCYQLTRFSPSSECAHEKEKIMSLCACVYSYFDSFFFVSIFFFHKKKRDWKISMRNWTMATTSAIIITHLLDIVHSLWVDFSFYYIFFIAIYLNHCMTVIVSSFLSLSFTLNFSFISNRILFSDHSIFNFGIFRRFTLIFSQCKILFFNKHWTPSIR